MPVTFSPSKIRQTSFWIAEFRQDWETETPMKLHAYGVDDGHGLGSPPFHPEFEHWLGQICFCGRRAVCAPGCRVGNRKGEKHLRECDPGCPSFQSDSAKPGKRNTGSRLRTTRAFRKLRKVAPREFDALYLMCAHKASFYGTMTALNQRAERLGKPERYSPQDLMLLVVSGVDKVCQYW